MSRRPVQRSELFASASSSPANRWRGLADRAIIEFFGTCMQDLLAGVAKDNCEECQMATALLLSLQPTAYRLELIELIPVTLLTRQEVFARAMQRSVSLNGGRVLCQDFLPWLDLEVQAIEVPQFGFTGGWAHADADIQWQSVEQTLQEWLASAGRIAQILQAAHLHGYRLRCWNSSRRSEAAQRFGPPDVVVEAGGALAFVGRSGRDTGSQA